MASIGQFAIVLDLDNTLVTSKEWTCEHAAPDWLIRYDDYTEAIYKRPGATEFLDYCFKTFRSVGIWTASTKPRACAIVKALLPPHGRLAFLMTREHCQSDSAGQFHKPISFLWTSPVLRNMGFLPSHTIFIDDNPINIKWSIQNLILVPPYVEPDMHDYVLTDLKKQFDDKLPLCCDIRELNKEWYIVAT